MNHFVYFIHIGNVDRIGLKSLKVFTQNELINLPIMVWMEYELNPGMLRIVFEYVAFMDKNRTWFSHTRLICTLTVIKHYIIKRLYSCPKISGGKQK